MRAPRSGTYVTAPTMEEREGDTLMDLEEGLSSSAQEKQNSEATKATRTKLSKLLKTAFRPEEITEEILHTKVRVTVEQLLAMKEMQKVWFGAGPTQSEHPLAGVRVGKLEATPTSEEEGYNSLSYIPFYIAAVPKMKALIAGEQVSVMLDSRAEISVISSDFANRVGLPVSTNVELGMLGVSDRKKRFQGVCEDVSVIVGRIEHRVPIWVIDGFGPDILLGRPYFIESRLALRDQGKGVCQGTITSSDGL